MELQYLRYLVLRKKSPFITLRRKSLSSRKILIVNVKFIILIAAASALRFAGLGVESLWLDEGITYSCMEFSWVDLLREFSKTVQAPLYYFIEKFWCGLFGYSEFALRFPSALMGILCVAGVYLLGRELFGERAGFYSAVVLAVNPFAVFYSQDARPYSLFLLTTLLSLYFFLRVMRGTRRGSRTGYVLTTAAMLYTHPYAPFVFAAEIIGWFVLKGDKRFAEEKRTLWYYQKTALLTVLLAVPQFLRLVIDVLLKLSGGSHEAGWIPVPAAQEMWRVFNQYFMSAHVAAVIVAFVLIVILWSLWRDRSSLRPLAILVLVAVFTVLLPWFISRWITPVFVHRYTIPTLGVLTVMIGWGLSRIQRISVRRAALAVFILLMIPSLFDYYTKVDKDPWREAVETVQESVEPHDVIVLAVDFTEPPFDYYYSKEEIAPVVAVREAGETAEITKPFRRVWLVEAYTENRTEHLAKIHETLAQDRKLLEEIRVTDRIRENPRAFYITDIVVRLYEERNPEDTPAVLDF